MKTLLLSITLCIQLVLFPVSVAHAGESKSAAVYAKAVSSLATGIVSSTVAASCPNGMFYPSVAIILAGGLGMVAGDLILSKKYTDYQKKKTKELKINEAEMKDSNGDFQKESIEQRLSMEKEELKNIKGRETLHYALGVAFTAASGVAIAETMIPYYYISNPVVICNPVTGEVMGFALSQAITLAWQMLASAGGGTSAAGSIFGMLQMVMGLMTKVNTKIAFTAMSSSASRAIFAGANAGLLYWVAADLTAKKKTAQENIAKLEELMKKVKSTTTKDGMGDGLPGADEYNDPSLNPKTNIKSLPTVAETKSCLSMTNTTASFGESSCKSVVKLSPVNFKGGINIPDLQNVASSAVKAANDLSSGNWEGAEVSLNDLTAKAAKIRDINEELQKKYNENMKAQGKPEIDFKGEIAKQTAVMQAELEKAMASQGGSTLANQPATISPTEEVKEESRTNTAAVAPVMDVPAMDLSGIGGGVETSDVSGSAPAKSLDESLNEYEVAESDIVKDPGVSIFKQVSNRYILNYNRFFDSAKKSLAPTTESESKTTPVATP